MQNFRNILFLFILCFIFNQSSSSPVGKGLSCFVNNKIDHSNFKSFRGLFFESDKSVRVVSFKIKNNSLKIISKQTPYKTSNEKIRFKIKFIWYGNISFEDFVLDRDTLSINHEFEGRTNKLNCEILTDDFMSAMNKLKLNFQINFESKLKSKKI